MDETPNLPSGDEIPERTIENVPKSVLDDALQNLRYRLCPYCNQGQWFYYKSGHNKRQNCKECGEELLLIG